MSIIKTIIKSFLLIFFLGLVEMACTSTPTVPTSEPLKVSSKPPLSKTNTPKIPNVKKIKKPHKVKPNVRLKAALTYLPDDIMALLRAKKNKR
ncbi:MAG: hypothetical protein Q9M50_14430 [Methylococcales bacterium]|nr:hypothetical protein [Methylococcales bacterium]